MIFKNNIYIYFSFSFLGKEHTWSTKRNCFICVDLFYWCFILCIISSVEFRHFPLVGIFTNPREGEKNLHFAPYISEKSQIFCDHISRGYPPEHWNNHSRSPHPPTSWTTTWIHHWLLVICIEDSFMHAQKLQFSFIQ